MAKQTFPVHKAAKEPVGKQKTRNKNVPPATGVVKQLKIQKALYKIALAASAVTDMQGFYVSLHRIVGKLMYAKNFYVSLYDPATGMLSAPYFADESGDTAPPPTKIDQSNKSLRAYVLFTGKTLHVSQKEIEEGRRRGKFMPMGTPAEDWIGVPLKTGGRIIGMLTIQSYKKRVRYGNHDVKLLEFVAQHIAVALTHARAIEETRQRNVELQIINSVQEALASKLNITSIYELIGEKVREVFNVQVVDIVNYDPTANLISMPYSYEKGDRSVISPMMPYGFRREVIDSRAPLLINQNFVEMAAQHNNPLFTGAWPRSALFVPMMVDGKVKSIISIQDLDRENAFSTSDVQLLQTLSNAMSVALENAHLFEETQRLLKETEQRAQELATVNKVSAAIAGELDLSTLIDLVGEQIRSVFRADIAFVALLDKENGIINFPYQSGQQHIDPIRWGEGITSKIIQSGKPLMINQDMDRQRQQMGVTLIGKSARSFLGVPIFVGDESIGVVSVQHSEKEGIFTENDQRLLSTIAANVGIAFQNAHLFRETQRLFDAEREAHQQTETLHSVAQALNRSLSLKEVFNLVLTEIQKVIPYDSAGIYQVHENRRVFVTGRGFANLDDLIGIGFEFNQQDDKIGYLISQSLQPLLLEDASVQYPQYFSAGPHAATKIRSYMAVPIVLNQKFIGMITLDREEPGFYKQQHGDLAMAFAEQAATAIHNARLFDETQRLLKETEQRNAELAIINSVQEGLASKLDMQGIYDLVGDKIREIFNVQAIQLVSFDHENNLMYRNYLIEKGQRLYVGPLPISKVWAYFISNPQTILLNRTKNFIAQIDPDFAPPVGHLPKSVIAVPLMVNNELRGAIDLENLDREDAFNESDVRLLETLANSMSVALENARLWEQEKMYRKALERELEIGREIQVGFLPEALPNVEGWEIAALLMSAREVAGDFYDAFELPDGTIGLVIADVCDKGVGAALFMTLFRSLIRAAANLEYFEHTERENTSHPAEERLRRAISLTNNYIAETHGRSGMFATIFFGILDPHNGKLSYINAGHEPPLIIQSGKVYKSLHKTGPAAGAIPDSQFEALEMYLDHGDLFFALTDGAFEAQSPRGEFFGRERLVDILQQDGNTPREPVKTIEAALHRFMDGATQFDDITLLAVRRW